MTIPKRDANGRFAGSEGTGKNHVPTVAHVPAVKVVNRDTASVPQEAAVSKAWSAFQARTVPVSSSEDSYGVTEEDVRVREWEREQAERMGLDPDTYAGPHLFTSEEWQEMTKDHESRVMFGLELPCGCRPGSCPSEYGGDCYEIDYEPDPADIEAMERDARREIFEDPTARRYVDPRGVEWVIRERENGWCDYTAVFNGVDDWQPNLAYTIYHDTGSMSMVIKSLEKSDPMEEFGMFKEPEDDPWSTNSQFIPDDEDPPF